MVFKFLKYTMKKNQHDGAEHQNSGELFSDLGSDTWVCDSKQAI